MSAARKPSGGSRRTSSASAPRKATGKTAVKKKTTAAKKASAKKAASKKTKATKAAARKPAAKKGAAKKAATRKVTKKKAVVRKTAAKTPPKTAVGKKKTAAQKAATKKVTKKKAVVRKKKTAAKARQAAAPAVPKGPSPSALRYREALDAYTKAVNLLQKKDWQAASRALADVVSEYPRERELSERARMYLRVCSQHLGDDDPASDDFDDQYYRAVVLSNKGRTNRALEIADRALETRPSSRKAMYLKASILAAGGRRREALDALASAIELDEQNRIYATNDPDFTGLRDDEEFITLTTREDDEEV